MGSACDAIMGVCGGESDGSLAVGVLRREVDTGATGGVQGLADAAEGGHLRHALAAWAFGELTRFVDGDCMALSNVGAGSREFLRKGCIALCLDARPLRKQKRRYAANPWRQIFGMC